MSTVDLSNPNVGLFPELESNSSTEFSTGVLPSQDIRRLIKADRIAAGSPIDEEQIQPASLDLRLGDIAHRIRASFLPGMSRTVEERIPEMRMVRIDLTKACILEKDCVYLVELQERVNLPSKIWGRANPKSSTGRLDIFTRLLCDYTQRFDEIPTGYKGKLYIEVVPRTFSIAVRAGMALNQLRLVKGSPPEADSVIRSLDDRHNLVFEGEAATKAVVDDGLRLAVNLRSDTPGEVIAYRAKKNAPVIELDRINYYPPEDFWEPEFANKRQSLVLNTNDFYILASKQQVRVLPQYAAEMVPFDPAIGEFRIHYAGFFDPGFGYGTSDIKGTKAVLEVRAHDLPFQMDDGQIVARLTYMRLLNRPDKIYGLNIGSSYQQQGLALSKHFKRQ